MGLPKVGLCPVVVERDKNVEEGGDLKRRGRRRSEKKKGEEEV